MFARRSVLILLTTLFIKAGEAFVIFLATNKYESSEFGYLTIANSFFAFFIFFSDLNFGTTHIKKMSEGVHAKSQYFSTYMSFKAIILPTITIAFVIMLQMNVASGGVADASLLNQVLAVMLVSSILNSINVIYQSSFQAEMNTTKMQSGNVLAMGIKIASAFLVVLFVDGFIFFVFLFLAYEAITLAVNIVMGRGYRLIRVNAGLLKEYLRFQGVFLLPSIISIVYLNLGPLFLAGVLGVEALGVYYVISRIVSLFSLIRNALQALLLPKISSDLKENNIDEIRRSIAVFEKYILILWGVICIGCFGAGKVLLGFFGAEYREGGLLMLLFEISFCYNWAWGPYLTILVSREDPRYILVQGINLALSIVAWIFLPPFIGIIAIDFGRFVATFPIAIYLSRTVHKLYGFGRPSRGVVIILVSVASIATLQAITGAVQLQGLTAILLTVLALGAFIASLFLSRVLTRHDITYIKTVLNPRKMLVDIRSDFTRE